MKAIPTAPERLSLLMVEMDVLVRHRIAEYLRQCGYKVFEAGNTDEAILIFTSGRVSVDVVLADAQAAGKLDGFGLTRWIRKNRPQVRAILAGTIGGKTKEAGHLCEDGPRRKMPYDPVQLLDQIKRAIAARDRAVKSRADDPGSKSRAS